MFVFSVASVETRHCFHDGKDRAAKSLSLSATCFELLWSSEGVFASVKMYSGES